MLKENIDIIKAKIASVCQKAGRRTDDVTLLAVSKTVGPEVVAEAVSAGHFNFAENKVQELAAKRKYFADQQIKEIKWHLIGHLQSNKVKQAVDNADLFHCLDSVRLAARINEYSATQNKIFPVLIQINSSGEESKSGILPTDLPEFLNAVAAFRNIRILGLMAIGRYNAEPEESRAEFKMMKQLYRSVCDIKQENCDFKYLSMGMSHDFEVAIEEGANIVRVGTAIFGERDYGNK